MKQEEDWRKPTSETKPRPTKGISGLWLAGIAVIIMMVGGYSLGVH